MERKAGALSPPALLRHCALLLLLQAGQVIGGALRVGGGGEYRALIFLKDGQPVPEHRGKRLPVQPRVPRARNRDRRNASR